MAERWQVVIYYKNGQVRKIGSPYVEQRTAVQQAVNTFEHELKRTANTPSTQPVKWDVVRV